MSPLRIAAFVAVLTVITGAAHHGLHRRLVVAAALEPLWERRLGWTLLVLAALVPLGLLLQRVESPWLRPLFYASFGWIGLAWFLVLFTALGDLVGVLLWAQGAARGAPLDEARRTTFRRGLSLVASGLAGAVVVRGTVEAFSLAVVRVRVPIRGLPAELEGLRIVQITDVHVGPLLRRGFVEAVVAQVNALRPDLVAVTGDLVDGSVDALAEHVAPLARLASRHGTFFVTGNHEYYSGVEAWRAHLRSLGLRVLENERVRLPGGLDLAGVEDYHGSWDLERALGGRERGVPCVLLAHQPKHAPLAARRGVDLVLSGHTHGGQFFPWSLVVWLQQGFVAGMYAVGQTALYVSRGTGFWGPPLRVKAPPEITEIVLTRAP